MLKLMTVLRYKLKKAEKRKFKRLPKNREKALTHML